MPRAPDDADASRLPSRQTASRPAAAVANGSGGMAHRTVYPHVELYTAPGGLRRPRAGRQAGAQTTVAAVTAAWQRSPSYCGPADHPLQRNPTNSRRWATRSAEYSFHRLSGMGLVRTQMRFMTICLSSRGRAGFAAMSTSRPSRNVRAVSTHERHHPPIHHDRLFLELRRARSSSRCLVCRLRWPPKRCPLDLHICWLSSNIHNDDGGGGVIYPHAHVHVHVHVFRRMHMHANSGATPKLTHGRPVGPAEQRSRRVRRWLASALTVASIATRTAGRCVRILSLRWSLATASEGVCCTAGLRQRPSARGGKVLKRHFEYEPGWQDPDGRLSRAGCSSHAMSSSG